MKAVRVAMIALALTALVAGAAGAQLEQGTWELSGSAAWTTSSYKHEGYSDSYTMTVLSISPAIGYFFAEGIEFRASFPVLFQSDENYNATQFGLEGDVLYHFISSGSSTTFLGVGVGMAKATDSRDSNYDTTLIAPAVYLGMRSFFGDRACLTTQLFYNHETNAMYNENVSANDFGLTVGLSIFF
jgi:hypothetical protein